MDGPGFPVLAGGTSLDTAQRGGDVLGGVGDDSGVENDALSGPRAGAETGREPMPRDPGPRRPDASRRWVPVTTAPSFAEASSGPHDPTAVEGMGSPRGS